MAELNYLRITKALGGTLTQTAGDSPAFGRLALTRLSAERFRLLNRDDNEKTIGRELFPEIAAAFEKVRDGHEVDYVIIDPVLSKRFFEECRRRGVNAPIAEINKRIQSFRKSGAYGIRLKPTTHESNIAAERYFYAAEFGYMQLSFEQPVSIDDIITDPETGEVFVEHCKAIAPSGSSKAFKWAALCLLKMRSFNKRKVDNLLAVSPRQIERQLRDAGTLQGFSSTSIPQDRGIYTFSERNGSVKYLYVGWGDDLRKSVEPFANARVFKAMAGPFWNPSPSDIGLSVGVLPKKWFGASPRDWSLRLVQARQPLFNIPVEIE